MTAPQAPVAPSYQIVDYVNVDQLKRDLAFSPTDLSSAMMQQSALFAHYGVQAGLATRQVDTVKLLLETTEAAVYQLLRAQATKTGEKLTEVQLEKALMQHERIKASKVALIEAKRVEATAKTAMESFRHRRDMLIQQGLISREEMKGDLRINGSPAREQAYQVGQNAASEMHRRAMSASADS